MLRLSLLALLAVLLAAQGIAQSSSGAPKITCNVTVTVTDSSGAVIQGAFVVLRADRTGTREPFELETQTNAAGSIKSSLPCGLIDVFVTADGSIPSAQKLVVRDETQAVSIPLRVYPRSDIQRVYRK
jgi:Carboxypeptidase regulatory-like domain